MASIADMHNGVITENTITSSYGAQSFISDPLNPNVTTFLRVVFNVKTAFEIGIHSYSLHSSTSSTFIIASNGNIFMNGTLVDCISNVFGFTEMTLSFDQKKGEMNIYDGSTKISSIHTPKRPASFILHTFGPTDISYSLGPTSPESIPMNNNSVKQLCPDSGKTVFRRNKRTPAGLSELLKKSPFEQTDNVPVVPKKPLFQIIDEED